MLEIVIGIVGFAIIIGLIIYKDYYKKDSNKGEARDHKDLKDSLIIIKSIVEKINDSRPEDREKLFDKLNDYNSKLNDLFEGQKEKINTNFQKQGIHINERLDEINKNATKILTTKDSVENLNLEIRNLRDIFTAKSKRGSFGEFHLYNLLELAFSTDERIWKKAILISSQRQRQASWCYDFYWRWKKYSYWFKVSMRKF